MTQIISLSGKMQSGKNTCCNFILGHCLSSLGIVREGFSITDKGQLLVNDIFGDKRHAGIFDFYNRNPKFEEFRKQNIDKYVKIYSYAYLLKKSVCVDILGIPYELVFGDNDAKNQLTEYQWKDMPSNIGDYTQQGTMTVREVMQYVGTEIFRKMHPDVWTNALMRQIKEDGSELALICDPRFPNEILFPKELGGISIRLTRNPFPSDHISETALDPENFNQENFDFILDNTELNISEQNICLYNIMTDIGLVGG